MLYSFITKPFNLYNQLLKIIYILLPLLVVFCSCGNSNNNSKGDDAKQIVKPGVTYVIESNGTATDAFYGSKVYVMEFTLYNDGTVAAKIFETNKESYYGNNNSYAYSVEGTWGEVYKHDKRFVGIYVHSASREFTFYIDEDHNVYPGHRVIYDDDEINRVTVSMSEK